MIIVTQNIIKYVNQPYPPGYEDKVEQPTIQTPPEGRLKICLRSKLKDELLSLKANNLYVNKQVVMRVPKTQTLHLGSKQFKNQFKL
jgi:hypothetical protein